MTTNSGRLQTAFTEFETDFDRARDDETKALEDLLDVVDEIDGEGPKAIALAQTIIRQEHAVERLRDIRADVAWRIGRALRRLREALG